MLLFWNNMYFWLHIFCFLVILLSIFIVIKIWTFFFYNLIKIAAAPGSS
jgi:hypothetical protein